MKFDYKKNVQILAYLANKEWWIIPYMKALKLIYFSDKFFIRFYWQTISEDTYVAMKNGPVASNIYTMIQEIKYPEFFATFDNDYIKEFIKKTGNYEIELIKEPDLEYLSKSEIEVLDKIYDRFGKKNQWELVGLTHNYDEWKQYESFFEREKWWKINMNISDFFKNSFDQDSIFEIPEEHLELSKEFYNERKLYI